MTRTSLMYLAAAGSLALLLGAFAFQLAGYAPCQMCIWQRWPHGVAVAAGALVALTGPLLVWGLAGALGALTTAGIGVFHTGVEQGWWEGPASCSGGASSMAEMTGAELLSLDTPVNIVMCDEVAWAFLGISMASWNAIISCGLMLLWIVALRTDEVSSG